MQASNINSEIAIAQEELEEARQVAQAIEKFEQTKMAAREAKRELDKLIGRKSPLSAATAQQQSNMNMNNVNHQGQFLSTTSAVSSSRNLCQRTLNAYPKKPRPFTTRLLPSNKEEDSLSKSKKRGRIEVSEDESSRDEEQAPKQRNKETKKRKRFTKEENKYIRRGVRRFVVPGEQIPWTDIRDYYLEMNGVFGDRTATNIRDRWRNMNK